MKETYRFNVNVSDFIRVDGRLVDIHGDVPSGEAWMRRDLSTGQLHRAVRVLLKQFQKAGFYWGMLEFPATDGRIVCPLCRRDYANRVNACTHVRERHRIEPTTLYVLNAEGKAIA